MKLSSIEIIKKLREKGYQALWAGGCVRDILLGVEPKDYDIVTSATPDQVEQLLPKTIPIGKQFGVILAESDGNHFEIATFRQEGDYLDGRRPSSVTFASEVEDASRRDFTINGLFYDPIADQILDFIEGQKDIEAKLVRFIGDPTSRIQEDNLRIIRAVRFKTTLDFQYHPETYQAIKQNADLIKNVSAERIQAELNKMLQSPRRVEALNDLEDLGLLEILLPEVQAMKGVAQPVEYHGGRDVYEHTMACLQSLPEDAPLTLVWATLLHDSGKPATFKLAEDRIRFDGHDQASGEIAINILNRLNFSRRDIEKVSWLCEHHMSVFNVLTMPLAAKTRWYLKPYFLELLDLHHADASGIEPIDLSVYKKILQDYRAITDALPDKLPKLITGLEIMELTGLPASPKIKQIVDQIEDLQYEGKITTREQAIEWVQNFKIV